MLSLRTETYASNGSLIGVVDNRAVSDVQNAITDAINAQRVNILSTQPMWFIGHPWQTDAIAMQNVNGAITTVLVGVPLPSNFVWRDLNNVNVPMDAKTLITFGSLMAQWVNTVYAYSWAFKEEIDQLTTLEELDTVSVAAFPWPVGNMDGTMPLAISPLKLANASLNNTYTSTFTVQGGIPPYVVSISNGSLPPGLSFANATLSGNATVDGTYTFTVQAVDSSANATTNTVALSTTQEYTIIVS